MKDFQELPKVRDSLSFLYVEHARVDQMDKAIALHRIGAGGRHQVIPVPIASLQMLMLGPGVSITHAAVRALADNSCLVAWCGEEGVRLYAFGIGGTRSARNLVLQARLASNDRTRLAVVERMYRKRLGPIEAGCTLQQIRGMEGIRVREAYAAASRATGVTWRGRSYKRDRWASGDPVNRALSAANSCLYGLCHAAVLATGFSPALGFVHTGKQLSFVYDIADLYKADLTIPTAFESARDGPDEIERRVRIALRNRFREGRILQRILPDIQDCLSIDAKDVTPIATQGDDYDKDPALPGTLWDPQGDVPGGVAYGDTPSGNGETSSPQRD